MKSGANVTGLPDDALKTKPKGGFFRNFGKGAAKEGTEQTVKKGAKFGLRKLLGKLFGPVTNFLVDMAFGEKLERALAGAAGFAAGSAVVAKIAAPLLALPIPGARIIYGGLVLGGGFLGEQTAKSLIDGIMGVFGKKTTKPENKVEPAANPAAPASALSNFSPNAISTKKLVTGPNNLPNNFLKPNFAPFLTVCSVPSFAAPFPKFLKKPPFGFVFSASSGKPVTFAPDFIPVTLSTGASSS
jgi:hypothetical protein